jgi:predicted DCC family thiol-disulfide oxidoreductase YuxK
MMHEVPPQVHPCHFSFLLLLANQQAFLPTKAATAAVALLACLSKFLFIRMFERLPPIPQLPVARDITSRSAQNRYRIHCRRSRPHQQPPSKQCRKRLEKGGRRLRLFTADLSPDRSVQKLDAC